MTEIKKTPQNPVQAIINTASYEERIALANFIAKRFPSTDSTFEEPRKLRKSFSLMVFDEGKAFGKIGTIVARDLSSKGFAHYSSVEDFIFGM